MTHLEIASLPLPEKIQLMESLWDSICQESSGEPEMPGWHKEILADRVTRLDAGEETVSTWEEAKKRIRAQVENH